MVYNLKVEITNPQKTASKVWDLKATFFFDPEQYGNGHYVLIKGKEGFEHHYDIRYDTSFRKANKIGWLEDWARSYWSGKNGAWNITHLEISKIIL